MKIVAKSFEENERQLALRQCNILDTPSEQAYDEIVFLVSRICSTPIAIVSLVDENRLWFKSKIGVTISETDRDTAFCSHTILQKEEPLIVSDTLKDDRFCDNPLVVNDPKIRFYAGIPIAISTGEVLGALCVIDIVPRELSADQIEGMKRLCNKVVALIELRKTAHLLHDIHDSSDKKIVPDTKTWNLNFKTETFNFSTEMTSLLGYNSQELKLSYHQFFERIHAFDRIAAREQLEEHRKTKTSFDIKVRLMDNQKSWRWCRIQGQVCKDDYHADEYMKGSLVDIHDAWNNEQLLIKNYLANTGSYSTPNHHAGCRVLIVEDTSANRFFLSGILTDLGCQVDEAENGFVALDHIANHTYDLIFMDCSMPVMDGYDATSAIRKAGYKMPIIAITSHTLTSELEKCVKVGMNDLVLKPFKKAVVLNAMDKWHKRDEPIQVTTHATLAEFVEDAVSFQDDVVSFDESILRNYLDVMPDHAFRLVQLTLTDVATLKANMMKAVQLLDAKSLAIHAHALKSVASQIGGHALYKVCRDLEIMGKSGDLSQVKDALESYALEEIRFKDWLDKLCPIILQQAS